MVLDWDLYLKQITSTIEQIVAQVTVEVARSKTLVTRSLRPGRAAMIGGLVILAPLGNDAAADPNSGLLTVLDQAKSQIQNMVISMSEGCPGGPHGVPPVSWAQLQPHAFSAMQALASARTALELPDQKDIALQQINIAESELDTLLNGVHGNCSGGAHGVDPPGMSGYLATRAVVQGRLDDVKIFLGG
jgi:hypothetical protein